MKLSKVLSANETYQVVTEQIGEVPHVDDCCVMQGGTCDGKYLWVVEITRKDYSDYSKGEGHVLKYDVETMEEICRSKRLPVGHANDIAYVPEKNELYIARCCSEAFAILDADTLEMKEITPDRGYYGHAVAYEPVSKRFAMAFEKPDRLKTNIRVLDEQLNEVYNRDGEYTSLITQGMYADEKYVYQIMWAYKPTEEEPENVIFVSDWENNLITKIPVGLKGLEPENLSIVDDVFYIVCYNKNGVTAPVFKGRLK